MEFKAVILIAEPPLSGERFEAMLPYVSKEKRERIGKFRFFSDAQNCLLGDILARAEICRATGLANGQLVFGKNKYEKPYLQGHPEVNFNISHCSHYVALAVDSKPVGIDIECVKPFSENIAKRFFAADEVSYINAEAGGLRCRRFFEVWTKKEALIKWEGKGLSKPLPSFSVFSEAEHGSVYFHEAFADDEVLCHVCTTEKNPPQVRVIGVEELLSEFEVSFIFR